MGKLCDTCVYRDNTEYFKPCIIYRDDCEHYEKERGDMTREEASFILANIDRRVCDDELNDALDMAIKALEQEPKTGHWITTRTFMHDGEYYCDKCKCDSPNNEKWDYCPNCGRHMVEPQESEE